MPVENKHPIVAVLVTSLGTITIQVVGMLIWFGSAYHCSDYVNLCSQAEWLEKLVYALPLIGAVIFYLWKKSLRWALGIVAGLYLLETAPLYLPIRDPEVNLFNFWMALLQSDL